MIRQMLVYNGLLIVKKCNILEKYHYYYKSDIFFKGKKTLIATFFETDNDPLEAEVTNLFGKDK